MIGDVHGDPFVDLEVADQAFRGKGRHPGICLMRQGAVIAARQVSEIGAQLAHLLHADPDNDAEIALWLDRLRAADVALLERVGRERLLRDIQGIA